MRRAIFVATTLLYQFSSQASLPAAPAATLPEGLELITAAASPLVKHPLMGCIDPDGALYVGDAQGLNLNKPELEKQLPNRVLKLVDEDGDGRYDRSTIFADKMTFPQGACWLGGSLYVASPPGIWKLTDTNHDGVADERTMIVGGFDYTGNAADVHGPFVHPNGRLYWCHGRKGHDVVQSDGGKRVHKGLASGIWSCLPDGLDIQWHSLACADNPVEVDFTPSGDIIGTCNLYQSQPRGDTLMHWLYGGVYERPDMMQAIVDLPRTLEHMPVMYNYGHVAVSGCAFYRTGALFPAGPKLQMLVTHFNTQRLVRMELEPSGSTYTATEHEFLKMEDPDIHLTDVIEDRDGSLIVLNTGGWFRIGCPSSLMAKPDVLGAVYRVRKQGQPRTAQRVAWSAQLVPASPYWEWKGTETLLKALQSEDRHLQRHACDAIASGVVESPLADGLNDLLSQELDPVLEHAAVNADMVMRRRGMEASQGKPLSGAQRDRRLSRSLLVEGQLLLENAGSINPASVTSVIVKLDQDGETLQSTVDAGLFVLDRLPGVADQCETTFVAWLNQDQVRPRQQLIMERVLCNRLGGSGARKVMARMLAHPSGSVRQLAWKIAANSSAVPEQGSWIPPLEAALAEAAGSPGRQEVLPALLGVITRIKNVRFDAALQMLAGNAALPVTLRLKAMSAQSSGEKGLSNEGFLFLNQLAGDPMNTTARIEAVRMLAATKLTDVQLAQVLEGVPYLGPLELAELLKGLRKYSQPEQGMMITKALTGSPLLGGFQESTFRTLCSVWPPEAYALLEPALARAQAAVEVKKRQLERLTLEVRQKGRPEEGRKHFEQGRGTCIACHKAANVGRAIGPDLSKIGAIRRERDLLESILFPSATLARDYEAHAIETSDGQSFTGLIRSHTAEGLLLVDLAGQEKNVPHASIVAQTTLTTSLMPMGLDQTMTEQELCDLVAWLLSLK